MDGSPRDNPDASDEIEFEQKFRGYDPDQVDAHLAQMSAEVARLEREVRDASARAEQAQRAPRPAAAAPPPRPAPAAEPVERAQPGAALHDPEGAVQRTLAIAQRTADEVLREAQAEADQLIADAERSSEELQREASKRSEVVREEAGREARRVAEATRQPLVDEIRQLEAIRDELQRDVALLERHLTLQRSQLSASLDRLQQLVDDPEAFRIDHAPATSDVRLPSQLTDYGHVVAPADGPTADPVEPSLSAVGAQAVPPAPQRVEPVDEETPDDAVEEGASVTDLAAARDEVLVEAAEPLPEPEPVDADDEPADEPEAVDESEPEAPVAPFRAWEPEEGVDELSQDLFESGADDDEPDAAAGIDEDDAWEGSNVDPDQPLPHLTGEPSWGAEAVGDEGGDRPTIFDQPADDGGEPTESVALIDELLGAPDDEDSPADSDRFLAELRRASADELGPPSDEADEAMARFFDQDDEDNKKSRFGRRS